MAEVVASGVTDDLPPVQNWGLDPLFHSHRCILIGAIMNPSITQIVQKPSYYEFYYLKRPFSKLEIWGIVVNKKVTKTRGTSYFS